MVARYRSRSASRRRCTCRVPRANHTGRSASGTGDWAARLCTSSEPLGICEVSAYLAVSLQGPVGGGKALIRDQHGLIGPTLTDIDKRGDGSSIDTRMTGGGRRQRPSALRGSWWCGCGSSFTADECLIRQGLVMEPTASSRGLYDVCVTHHGVEQLGQGVEDHAGSEGGGRRGC